MFTVDQQTAAGFVGLSTRRLKQLDQSNEGPARDVNGRYLVADLGKWFRRRIAVDLGVSDDGQVYDLANEKARLAKEQADGNAMKNAALRGDLVRISLLERVLGQAVSAFRTNTLAIPTKLAPELEGLSAPEIKAALEREAHQLLDLITSLDFRTREVDSGDTARAEPGEAADTADGEPVGRRVPRRKPRGKREAGSLAD